LLILACDSIVVITPELLRFDFFAIFCPRISSLCGGEGDYESLFMGVVEGRSFKRDSRCRLS